MADEPEPEAEEPQPLSLHWQDPRIQAVELLVRDSEWQKVCAELGPIEKLSELPPALVLVYAVARKELGDEGDDTALNMQAIAAMKELVGAGQDSDVALMLTKRLLRRTPVAWRRRPVPHSGYRVTLMVVALALGIVAGWAMGPGSITLREFLDALK
jgi:hypothetical protein